MLKPGKSQALISYRKSQLDFYYDKSNAKADLCLPHIPHRIYGEAVYIQFISDGDRFPACIRCRTQDMALFHTLKQLYGYGTKAPYPRYKSIFIVLDIHHIAHGAPFARKSTTPLSGAVTAAEALAP